MDAILGVHFLLSQPLLTIIGLLFLLVIVAVYGVLVVRSKKDLFF